MGYQIKNIGTGTTQESDVLPVWQGGIWECGSFRITDQHQDQYEVVDIAALQTLTPMTFYLCFTPQERIDIKASADPLVKELWSTYDLSVQLGKNIDPNLASIAQAVAYLAQGPDDTPPGPQILKSKDRVDQILTGTMQ